MFQGSIPHSVQQMLLSITKEWKTQNIQIGCSGNFTTERVLQGDHTAALHSNDVTIYSCMLGRYFSGQKLDISFNHENDSDFNFIKNYMDDDASVISCILLLSKIATFTETKSNPYYERMISAYIDQWETLFTETYKKIKNIQPFIKSFYEGDVCELIDVVPQDYGFICYPPFYSGGYEKMFRLMERLFNWQPPEYMEMDAERIIELLKKITERRYFMFITKEEQPEYKDYLRGLAQTTNHGAPLYIYANGETSKVILPVQKVESPLIERIGENDDIGDDIKLIHLTKENFNALRAEYLNPEIELGRAALTYGVTVNNKLVGSFAFIMASSLAKWDNHIDTPAIYLLSDFSVAPTKYKKLSKLILYAVLSKESQILAEQMVKTKIRGVITTAFSKNPVSMKYRGLFKLMSKKQDGEKYMLNYGASMGEWTLKQGLELWKKNHSQTGAMKNED